MRNAAERVSAEKVRHLTFSVYAAQIQLRRQWLYRDGHPCFRTNHMHDIDLGAISARDHCRIGHSPFRYFREIGCEKDVLEGDTLFQLKRFHRDTSFPFCSIYRPKSAYKQ